MQNGSRACLPRHSMSPSVLVLVIVGDGVSPV